MTITMTKTNYNKNGQKWAEVNTERQEINKEFYNNFINAKTIFNKLGKERQYKSYTPMGYVVTDVHTTSPNGLEKILTKFDMAI